MLKKNMLSSGFHERLLCLRSKEKHETIRAVLRRPRFSTEVVTTPVPSWWQHPWYKESSHGDADLHEVFLQKRKEVAQVRNMRHRCKKNDAL